ncbi:hypothetical protein [Raoultella ornithinolytica]|uniref:hypothetical protein n=1 Tax=Raoultella ornithinolytica TaxID=54291 RepID=UPI0007DAD11F|nr:hypothetical protein [Raoultella ornithinolytica]ANZ07337.1 hypothetical protein HY59_18780 [Raoultella ornithinolytica]
MKTSEILKASNINELRAYGSYLELKNIFEKELGNKIEVKGWNSFFSKIQNLKIIIPSNKKALESAYNKTSLKESKKEISTILTIKIKAKNQTELKKKVDSFIFVFCSSIFDPYTYYERTKLKKFKDSSKLEGINIDILDEKSSLENVLKKYKR